MLSRTPTTLQALRVAMVASSLRLAGAEKQTVYVTRALQEAGTDVRFFHLGDGGHYATQLRRLRIPFHQIYRRHRPLYMLVQLARAFCRFRPQIVFAPQFGDLAQGGLAGRFCNALVLGGLRSDGFYELSSHGRWSRWVLRLADGLIANSERARQNLRSRVAKPPRISILPNVLDLREFDARSEMSPPISIPPDRVMAVAVGSLQPNKRFDRFIQALALARSEASALFGVIAGADCGCRAALRQEAAKLGLSPNHLVFLGECDHVPALLAQADILVLCSEYEGFPNVILEAMAASLPVIATRVGDNERVVLHDQTGYVVDEPIVEALAERMVELACSPAVRLRLGTAGRRRVVQEYDYESLAVRLLSVFSELSAQSRRHRLLKSLPPWFPVAQSNPPPDSLLCGEPAAGPG